MGASAFWWRGSPSRANKAKIPNYFLIYIYSYRMLWAAHFALNQAVPSLHGDMDMTEYRRVKVTMTEGVAVVSFTDRKILDATAIEELAKDLFALCENDGVKIVSDFVGLEFLSAAALNKLIILDKMIRRRSGKLAFCNIRPEIMETFEITRLDKLFIIKMSLSEALQWIRE